MAKPNYRQIYAAKANREKEILKICPNIPKTSGIYVFYRVDEYGIKHSYVGQAVNLLDRCVSHLMGYQQHIDRSLMKYKLYDVEKNPYGWKLGFIECSKDKLDDLEKMYIKKYADAGFQMKNTSLGGQGEGRNMINETKPAKGYRDGLLQGKLTLARDLSHIINLHLNISLKKPSKTSEKALEKFNYLLNEDTYKQSEENRQ